MIFDTHSHLDSNQFNDDFETVVENLKSNGISYVLDPGCDIPTSKKSIELAKKYDFIYSAVGFHPHEAKFWDDNSEDELTKMSQYEKVVAIGEIGLDYYYFYSPKELQQEVFIKQIQLAEKLNLPFIIHSRDASKDTYDIVKKYKKNVDCVLHCFSQSLEMAKLYIDIDCYLSFAGPVTFKKSTNLQEVAKYAPLDKILIETDAPYLSPEPKRGKRNEPANVKYIGQKIADLKNIDEESLFNITTQNAKRFFKIA